VLFLSFYFTQDVKGMETLYRFPDFGILISQCFIKDYVSVYLQDKEVGFVHNRNFLLRWSSLTLQKLLVTMSLGRQQVLRAL
jgi:hypothetical protein